MKNISSNKKLIALMLAAALATPAMLAACSSDNDETTAAVTIDLNGNSASCDSDSVLTEGSVITISDAGTYVIRGTLTDGQIAVEADEDDEVTIVLDGAEITSSASAALLLESASSVILQTTEDSNNLLSNGGTFGDEEENEIDGVVFSLVDLTLEGTGTLSISSPAGKGITCKADMTINSGTYEMTCLDKTIKASGSLLITDGDFVLVTEDDGLHAACTLTIDGGLFEITAGEGIESTVVTINDGTFVINATDDGINASNKSDDYSPSITINGGSITIIMAEGDTDAIDSNGDLIITGGTIDITGMSAFDYDGTCEYTGGTLILNGEQVDSISNQFEGEGSMPGEGSVPGADFEPPEGAPEGFEPPEGTPPEGAPEGFDGTPPEGMPEGLEPPEGMPEPPESAADNSNIVHDS